MDQYVTTCDDVILVKPNRISYDIYTRSMHLHVLPVVPGTLRYDISAQEFTGTVQYSTLSL